MSLHFKINPTVYVDTTARGKARPVFFEVKPQLSGIVGGEGAGVDNQLGNYVSKTGDGPAIRPNRDAFQGSYGMGKDVSYGGGGREAMSKVNVEYCWCVLRCSWNFPLFCLSLFARWKIPVPDGWHNDRILFTRTVNPCSLCCGCSASCRSLVPLPEWQYSKWDPLRWPIPSSFSSWL